MVIDGWDNPISVGSVLNGGGRPKPDRRVSERSVIVEVWVA